MIIRNLNKIEEINSINTGFDCVTALNGSDEEIGVAFDNSLQFPFGQAFGIGAWVNQDNLASYCIMSCQDSAFRGYVFRIDSGKLFIGLTNVNLPGLVIQIRADTLINAGVKDFVYMNYTGSGDAAGVTFYHNGVAISSVTVISGTNTGTLVNTQPLAIGVQRAATSSSFYKGQMSDISMYNVSKTAGEVLALYNKGSIDPDYSSEPGIISHWKLDGLNPPDVIDIIGGNHGTSVNMDITNQVCN